MTVSPTVSAWINLAIALLGAAGGLSAQLTPVFGSGTTDHIVTVASAAAVILGTLNTALHGVSSAAPGPLTPKGT